jgi:hypothetical protein
MTTEKQTGRLIGALLLAAMLLGIWNNFVLTEPIFSGAGYLHNGAKMPLLFGASALLGLATSGISVAVAVMALPILRKSSPALAMAFVVMAGASLAVLASEQASFLSMQSLSQQFAEHADVDPVVLQILRGTVSANRDWIHFLDKILGGASILVLYLALYRSHRIPRFIPAAGVVAAVLQMTGISLELFSLDLPKVMLAPLALTQLVLCLTLLARGLAPPARVHSPAVAA